LNKSFELKPIKEGGKTISKHYNFEIFQMTQQFITAPTSPNLYVTHTLNNMNLVKTINDKKKDWTKKYHKIIWGIEKMVNVQITEIESTILQASNNYWMQTVGDIFSISGDLQDIIHMKN